MGFSELTFLFILLPGSVILYLLSTGLKRIALSNALLAVISLAVYWWVSPETMLFFVIFTVTVYVCGLAVSASGKGVSENVSDGAAKDGIGKTPAGGHGKRLPAAIGICLFTLTLAFFKYVPAVMKALGEKKLFGTAVSRTAVPVGISFVTFEAISYIVDVYRKDAPCGSILDVFLFISFFPKIVSGPIVLWKDFYPQLKDRISDFDVVTRGIDRIIVGFAKKVIIADTFGAQIALIEKGMEGYGADSGMYWLIALLYFFQIYFDFAGYSDIAIGLMNIFGFDVKDNFDSPYVSLSVSEFWRRWHISLGTWFREYVYIPLGGNRRGNVYFNLSVVFLLTGIWHGASLTFLLWGVLHGFFVVTERVVRKKGWYKKIPAAIKWVFTMAVVFFGWILFRCESLPAVGRELSSMFEFSFPDDLVFTWRFYLTGKIIILLALAVFSSVAAFIKLPESIKKKLNSCPMTGLKRLSFLLVFAADIIFIVNSSYSPFLYFQF